MERVLGTCRLLAFIQIDTVAVLDTLHALENGQVSHSSGLVNYSADSRVVTIHGHPFAARQYKLSTVIPDIPSTELLTPSIQFDTSWQSVNRGCGEAISVIKFSPTNLK